MPASRTALRLPLCQPVGEPRNTARGSRASAAPGRQPSPAPGHCRSAGASVSGSISVRCCCGTVQYPNQGAGSTPGNSASSAHTTVSSEMRLRHHVISTTANRLCNFLQTFGHGCERPRFSNAKCWLALNLAQISSHHCMHPHW